MEVEIEILKPEQWKEYLEIRLSALKTDPAAFGESYEGQLKKSSEEALRKKLSEPNRKVYIARVSGRIIALASYTLVLPGRVDHNAQIHSVFVDPDFRGKGVGFAFMRRIIDDLYKTPKISRVTLSTNNEQEVAKKLYKKLGFKECGLGTKEMKVNGKYCDQAHMELIFEDKL